MPCWVVPSIAAEYWRLPPEQVQDRINRHAVPIRRENGFTFIDILPDPPSDKSLAPSQRPSTFTAAPPVTQETVPPDISRNPIRLHTAAQRRAPVPA